MAPRRRRTKSAPRKRFRGLNVLNTAVDLYQANAVTTAFLGQGIGGAFIAPFMPGYERYGVGSAGMDAALDIKEIFDSIMGQGLYAPGTSAGKGYVVPGGGAPSVRDMGLGGAVMEHLKVGAVPAMIRVFGAGAAKKIIRKSGVTRSLNKITKQIGLSDLIRW